MGDGLGETVNRIGGPAQKGQNIVELALLLPILLLLLLGVLDFGRSFYYYISVTNAAREGARYAVLHPGGDVAGHVADELGAGIPIDPGDITISPGMTPSGQSEITVSVSYSFELVAGVFWSTVVGWPNPLTVTGAASMPVTASP